MALTLLSGKVLINQSHWRPWGAWQCVPLRHDQRQKKSNNKNMKKRILLLIPWLFMGAKAIGDTSTEKTPSRDPAAFLFFGKKNAEHTSLAEQGLLRYATGDCTGALNTLEAAKIFEPDKVTLWAEHVLFHSLLTCGNYDRAQTVAEEIARSAPQESLSFLQLGIAELWNRKTKPAIENFKRALEFDSHSPRTHFYKGIAHGTLNEIALKENEFKEGEKEYQRILARNPKDFTANFELASLYLYWNKEVPTASKHVSVARDSLPTPSDELSDERKLMAQFTMPLLEGILLYRMDEPVEAAEKLRETLAHAPSGARADVAELYFYLGKSLLASNEKEKARGALQKVNELDPNGPYGNDAKRALASKK